MSSSSRNTLTNRRNLPDSSKSRSPKPGWSASSSALSTSADGGASTVHLGRAAGEVAQLGGDADRDRHVRPPRLSRGERGAECVE